MRPHSDKRYDTEAVDALLSDDRDDDLREIFDELHATDMVDLLLELPLPLQLRILFILDPSDAGDILDDLPDRIKDAILSALDVVQRQQLISEMASDELADFFSGLDKEKARQFLAEMSNEDATEVRELLSYDPESAGGLMITEFVAYPREFTVAEVMNRLPQEVLDAELIYYIYTLAKGGRLAGVISLRQLVMAHPGKQLKDLADTNLLKVRVNSSQDEVVEILMRYDLLALPVVDDNMVLRGIITYDSIADIVSEDATEEVYAFAGVRGGEEESEWNMGAWQRSLRRLPWLLICLVFGIIGGGQIIENYRDVISTIVPLAFFMPVLMDTAGNVATQSVAIAVRGLATGELDSMAILRITMREALIGVFIGIVGACIVALSAFVIWQESLRFCLAIGVSMVLTLMVSSFIGALLPLLSTRFNFDPAVTSGPLATTILDIVGLIIYFYSAVTIIGIS